MRVLHVYLFPFRSASVLRGFNNVTDLTNTLFSPDDKCDSLASVRNKLSPVRIPTRRFIHQHSHTPRLQLIQMF